MISYLPHLRNRMVKLSENGYPILSICQNFHFPAKIYLLRKRLNV